MLKKTDSQKGFTLVELMVVMGIIAVLALLTIGAISAAKRASIETVHRTNAKAIEVGLQTEYAKTKKYCGGTSALTCDKNPPYNLQTAADALGVSISSGHSQESSGGNNCADGGSDDGGGWVEVKAATPNAFKIEVWDANCTADAPIDTITQ